VAFDRYSDEQILDLAAQGFDAENVDYSSVTFVSVGYGVTDDITLVTRLPYVHLDDVREPVGTTSLVDRGDASGHGDLLLLSLVELWQSESGDMQVSAILGVEAPTGRTDSPTLQGDTFAFEHQASSRSWDSVLGASASMWLKGWSFHANGTYRWTADGHEGTELGDAINYNAAAVYRLLPERPVCECPHCRHEGCYCGCCHEGRSVDFVLEVNGAWQDNHVIGGQLDHDSGGHQLMVSPGLRLNSHEPWCIYSSCGLPIFQEQNRANRETEIRLVLGFIVNY
jgi:hypothetical protein